MGPTGSKLCVVAFSMTHFRKIDAYRADKT